MSAPTVLDLFAGACGGWSLGLHRAGFRTVAACEIDPWRRAVFSRNFPDAKVYEDVRELGAARLVQDGIAIPDVVVGSPPCQDASAANSKGRGVDGERTGLFFEAIRIVGECRPRWCAFENSPRLRTRGVDRLLVELEALGYACWPLVVGADDVGSPHQRKRMWLLCADTESIGRRAGASWGPCVVPQGAQHRAHEGAAFTRPDDRSFDHSRSLRPIAQAERCVSGSGDACDTDGAGLAIGEGLTGDARAQFEALERAVGPRGAAWNGGSARHLGLAHGLSARLAGTRVPDHKHPGRTVNAGRACISAYGDAVLPQITEAIGRAILTVEAAMRAEASA